MTVLEQHLHEIVDRYRLGGDPVLSGQPARGEWGEVRRLDTTTGAWAVKVLFQPSSEEAVRESVEFQSAAVAAGVPAPDVVRTTAGNVLTDIDGTQVRVYGWVDLEEIDLRLDPEQVGTMLARLHRVPFPSADRARWWDTRPVGRARWDELIDQMAAARAPQAEGLAAVRDELSAVEELLEAPTGLRQCHLDLWAENMRATPTGGLCVFDWDNSGAGDPSHELAMVLFEFWCGDARRAGSIYRSYLDAGGPGRLTRPGDFSMVIAQLGHIAEYQCRRWLEASSPEEKAHPAGEIEGFLDRHVTRAVVDALLDAVNG